MRAELAEIMAKTPKKPRPPKKRNIIARDAAPRPGAGPMKDKRKLSRQEQRRRDREETDRSS